MLESEGIAVHLLNRESPFVVAGGSPFMIQLQVDDQNVDRAAELIRSRFPSRFGNEITAKQAGDAFGRGARHYLWSGISSIIILFALEAAYNPNHVQISGMFGVNIVLGLVLAVPIWLIYEGFRKFTKRG
jgi:hypothetical protein